jgi:hypothetical protein
MQTEYHDENNTKLKVNIILNWSSSDGIGCIRCSMAVGDNTTNFNGLKTYHSLFKGTLCSYDDNIMSAEGNTRKEMISKRKKSNETKHELSSNWLCVNCYSDTSDKSQQHPKDFPGGPPPQYYPGLATFNFRVRMGSGAFDAVWPLANK